VSAISDWGKYDKNGKQEKKVVFPFSLRFEPHSDVNKLISSKYKADLAFLDDLEAVPANSRLYKVYAMTKPKQLGGKEINIGTIQLVDKLYKSKWADENLFFRHQRQDEDLKYHPEWENYSPKNSLEGKCPYEKHMKSMFSSLY